MTLTNKAVMSPHNDVVLVCGSFAPNGTNDPTTVYGSSEYTVVRNGSAGEWKLTFVEKYPELLSGHAQVQMAAATDVVAQLATYTAAASGSPATLLVRALAGATPTDIAAAAQNRVHFAIYFKKTTFQT